MILIFGVFLITSPGLQNFKLDASSDALVLEGDDDFKIYRETGEIFGNSDFLIITFSPHGDLFSSESLSTIKSLEIELEKISSVESVLSILDAPIFFQPKVPLADLVDNIKNRTAHIVVNTVGTSSSQDDSLSIRREALQHGIPYFTTIQGIQAAVSAIEAMAKASAAHAAKQAAAAGGGSHLGVGAAAGVRG